MDIVFEPDAGLRNTKFHKRIVSIANIPNTKTGHNVALECGHRVQTFGDLSHAAGVVLCLQCRNEQSSSTEETTGGTS